MTQHATALSSTLDVPTASQRANLELGIVVPTFDESGNVPLLIEKLAEALRGIAWEVIFVDDHSPDGTADLLRSKARVDARIRVIERVGRRGLSSACIEGIMASAAPYVAVMDADLQHDESLLAAMLEAIQASRADLVIASRNLPGGSMGEFAAGRTRLSRIGQRISRVICRCDVSDPMSGFFLIDAGFFRSQVPRLTGSGFKILLDILSSTSSPPRIVELPYRFRMRQSGESKLDANVELEYLYLILDKLIAKLIGRWFPTRFALYLCVGALGVGVHLAVLALFYMNHWLAFAQAQVVATLVAMTSNFLLNNIATFRSQRLRGGALFFGLLKFYAACSLGAIINLAFANLLVHRGMPWLLAGACGTAISSVWNYGVNTVFTWRRMQA